MSTILALSLLVIQKYISCFSFVICFFFLHSFFKIYFLFLYALITTLIKAEIKFKLLHYFYNSQIGLTRTLWLHWSAPSPKENQSCYKTAENASTTWWSHSYIIATPQMKRIWTKVRPKLSVYSSRKDKVDANTILAVQ